MKKISLVIAAVVILSSIASAEMLLTAGTLGQGKFGLQTAYVSTTNHTSSMNNTVGYGGLIGYGVLPVLDVYGIVGFVDYNNLGGTGAKINGPQVGGAVKCRLLDESPISLSGLAAYRSTNYTVSYANNATNAVMDDISGGLILSKNIDRVIPYVGAVYHMLTIQQKISSGNLVSRGNDTEVNAGVKFNPVENLGLVLEYAVHSSVFETEAGTSSSNVSLSVGTEL